MLYSNEYQILIGLREHFKNTKTNIDITLYEIVDGYLKNPFDISSENLEILESFIIDKKQLDVYSLAPSRQAMQKKIKHIKPSKLSNPTAKVRRMYGRVTNDKIHIPVNTKTLRFHS